MAKEIPAVIFMVLMPITSPSCRKKYIKKINKQTMRMMARFQTLFNVAVFFKKRPDKLVPNPGIKKINNKIQS